MEAIAAAAIDSDWDMEAVESVVETMLDDHLAFDPFRVTGTNVQEDSGGQVFLLEGRKCWVGCGLVDGEIEIVV